MYAMVAAGLALMLRVARLINFAHGEFFMLGAALVICWGRPGFVPRTRAGRAMRAMSQNREACAVVGVDVQRVTMVTFALSAALAALAAALVSPLFNIFPDMGTVLTLKAFAAVVAGGFGYGNGAIPARLLIGLTGAPARRYVSYAYKDAIPLLMIIAVPLWPPPGPF